MLLPVDLFVRSWVETQWCCKAHWWCRKSTSSWGRELKQEQVSITVDAASRPLREVVSWNTIDEQENKTPVASTSSWGRELKQIFWYATTDHCGRPLREVVSWNMLARQYPSEMQVDLFVRSWVETITTVENSRNSKVDLFVRSWVETVGGIQNGSRFKSTSSWGRELKLLWHRKTVRSHCRPLREVVSWNSIIDSWHRFSQCRPLREVVSWNEKEQQTVTDVVVDLFVRSWVETSMVKGLIRWIACRPLREVVSWNYRAWLETFRRISRPLREVVSWNICSKCYYRVL